MPERLAPLLALLLSGCVSLRAGVGPVPALEDGDPGSVQLDLGFDYTLGPTKRQRVAGGRMVVDMLDDDARCHYGFGFGLHGRVGRQAAMVAPALDGHGHCHFGQVMGLGARAGLELLSLGQEQDALAVGLGSPTLQAGPRLTLDEGFVLELQGLLGYQVRVSGPESYPVAGGMLLLSYGLAL